MDREAWQRVKRVAADAWARPASERSAYAIERCADDDVLRREVLSLLEAMDSVGERFDTPALVSPAARLAAAEALDRQTVAIGQRIGPWRLAREIGHGGMGTVYLADRVDGEFEQRVAIKVVRGWIGDEVLQRKLRDERRILAALAHPNIARLIDGGTIEGGLPYVVMEHIDGVPIDAYCTSAGLDVRRRIDVFRKVCAAVHHAHQHLIVHRDIKTTNILVMTDGTPKLLDFGIAKILDEAPGLDSTQTLFRLLTPESASPEQLRGQPITTAADVYSLGILLYRLLTGDSPYRPMPRTETELVQAVCERMPAAPSAVVHSIDADLDNIVLKALRKEPDRRYATVDQFSEDLGRYLDGRPVLAAPDSAAYRARKFVSRHRRAAALAAALVVAVAGGTAATLWQARAAQRERARAERQFNAVRSLAGSVLGELYDTVTALPGSLAARELLIRRATDYLDTLSAEASANLELRRELANGYNRLAQLQGAGGVQNLGDRDTARRTFLKAAALLESIDTRSIDVDTRLTLAETCFHLSGLDVDDARREARFVCARQIVDGVVAEGVSSPRVLGLNSALWQHLGNQQESRKDYANAVESFTKSAGFAEAMYKAHPDDRTAARNLSLGFKKIGTDIELLGREDDAMHWYEKALALDRVRVAARPDEALIRLDLSFSLGAIGSLAATRNDLETAWASYGEAVALRRGVLASDPRDEFARAALVRGYERYARVLARTGRGNEALEAETQRVSVSRAGLAAHPERDPFWSVHAAVLQDAIGRVSALLESPAPAQQLSAPAAASAVKAMLAELEDLRAKWAREKGKGALPPASAEWDRLVERAHRAAAIQARASR